MYSNMSLIDSLQAVEGVMVAEMISSQTKEYAAETYKNINAMYRPVSGYFSTENIETDITLNMTVYN